MTTVYSSVFLVLAAFLASAVEMVEALTIVLAMGITRGWRSANTGVVLALLALAAIVAVLGPALTHIPIGALRLVVGTILLIFGLQWLRKAILRSSGYKALHDEEATYREEMEAAKAAGKEMRAGLDWYAFTISFKGVLLEGLEVAFIVLTFGTTYSADYPESRGSGIALAALGAGIAVILVGVAGVALHRPLSTVPENTMKFAVGLMLTTFGTFWGAEGAGVTWPGSDVAILGLLVFFIACSFGMVWLLRRTHAQPLVTAAAAH